MFLISIISLYAADVISLLKKLSFKYLNTEIHLRKSNE